MTRQYGGTIIIWGTRWSSWLRHCARSRKVVGSIPDGAIRIFHRHNPSSRTMALESTLLLTEISKGGRCVGLAILQPSWASASWNPLGQYGDCFTFSSHTTCNKTLQKLLTKDFFSVTLRPNAGHGFLTLEVSRSHTTTHHSR